jgi:hypothetical protein
MRARAIFASIGSILLASAVARAAGPVPSLDLRGFRAPVDPAAGVYVEPAASPATGEWNVGLWTAYAYRPISLRDATTGARSFDVLRHQLSADLVGSVGLWGRLQLGVDLPFLLYQTGDKPTPAATRALGDYVLPAQAFGDLALLAKLTIVPPRPAGGFALALDERLTVPTGDTASFLGEGAVTSEARFLGEYRIMGIGIHAALGFKARGHQVDFACGAAGEACTSRFGHEIPFGLGVSFRPERLGIDDKGRWTWFLEMHGHGPVGLSGRTATASVQLDAAARVAVGHDLSLLAGLGTGFAGPGDAPLRALLSLSWAPRNHDRDGDGIPDELDQCPDLPEDRDGYQDEDGCPDLDNDGDGIPDSRDLCPNTKEDLDGFQDDDGCPDPDNDQDKIPDVEDACPNEPGPPSPDPKRHGCPFHDKDGDGIADDKDACPTEAGPPNADPLLHGCPPTHDADGDGIADVEDACPTVKGVRSSIPQENGCPDPDPDKDTFIGDEDKCPNEPETWNGFLDGDGCPDAPPAGTKARPPVIFKERKGAPPSVELAAPLTLTAAREVDAPSLLALRALASELAKHPSWKVLVGARPTAKEKQADAEARAKAVVAALRKLGRREGVAEAAPWAKVSAAPGAGAAGLGFVIVALPVVESRGAEPPREKPSVGQPGSGVAPKK